jgi:hypothetical protein
MAQLGFFDADRRLSALSAKGDPLEAINALMPWESFRAEIEAVVLTPEEARKSTAGRTPIDAIEMFRMLEVQSLQYLRRADRLSGARPTVVHAVSRLALEDRIPDATSAMAVPRTAG